MSAKLEDNPPGSPMSTGSISFQETKQLAAAARERRRSDFSVAVTLVVLGSISYGLFTFYLCRTRSRIDEIHDAFYAEVPDTIYMWPMVAFATALLLNTLSWLFEQRPARKQLCFLAVYISGVAFVYEFLAWRGVAPIFITATGRPNSLLRYVMWGHATPAMLYALSLISDFEPRRVAMTIGVDIFMIATVIPGELIPTWDRWIWNTASCAVFPYIAIALWQMYSDAIESARDSDRAAVSSLRALRAFTVIFWTVFPIIWVLVQAQLVSVYTEEILWSSADICGKIFFSSSLLHGNFVTIESRRLMAMRAIEESNRVKAIHELKQLVEQKEGFIALMSHELRTPLNGIIGLSNSLLMDLEPTGETARTVATIRNSGARLLNLINDILDAAALRKGRLVVGRNRVVLQHAVQDVLELTSPLAKSSVRLINRISKDVPPVLGDASRLVQVLYNLIGNACKFTERGQIVVDAAVDDVNGMVAVLVQDSGIGIPQDKLLDIFSPFEQVDMSARRQYGGTGLGLNLAKQLIEAHGGTISVVSDTSEGSTFTFTVPTWKEGSKNQTGNKNNSGSKGRQQQGSQPRRFSWQRYSNETQERQPLLKGGDEETLAAAAAAGLGGGSDSDDNSNSTMVSPMRGNQRGNRQQHEADGIARAPSVMDLLQRASHDEEEPAHMLQRLSMDSQPINMLRRLSMDAQARSSFEFERAKETRAPQQLDPSEAAAAFLTASAPLRISTTSSSKSKDGGEIAGNGTASAAATPTSITTQGSGPPSPPVPSPSAGGGAHWLRSASWPAAAAAVAAAERAGDVHILSVDDDPVNQMVIQTMLRRAGFKVSKACDGLKALEMLEGSLSGSCTRAPDMMLLDVMMPGMSGYDVVRVIREKYPSLVLPVILVSANGHEDQVVEGLNAGASDYITKPFGQRELVARITTQLRTKTFVETAAAVQVLATAAGAGGSGGSGGGGGGFDPQLDAAALKLRVEELQKELDETRLGNGGGGQGENGGAEMLSCEDE